MTQDTTRDPLLDSLEQTRAALRGRMAALRAQIDDLMAPTRSLRAELETKMQAQFALAGQIDALNARINAHEQPHLHQLKTKLAEVARLEIDTNAQIKRMTGA